ncbi:VOC family protein [Bdellovibrio sp. HCB290]|uniref:VOC family protein n=1 Tax=Bdellovibrio sp. HCB290 TaxID=3394356 RepID=UPI0039B3D16B
MEASVVSRQEKATNVAPATLNFSAVLIFCENIRVMTDFYSDKLGLPIKDCGQTCSSFETSFGLGITLRQVKMDNSDQKRDHIVLGFYVDDIEKLKEQLAAKGVEMGPIQSRSIGKVAEIKDPEGNIIGFQRLPS